VWKSVKSGGLLNNYKLTSTLLLQINHTKYSILIDDEQTRNGSSSDYGDSTSVMSTFKCWIKSR